MLDELVSSLLYEGYALYPYTPGATKNATPTPFGIVYPPRYAADSGATFDLARLECLADAQVDATLSATVWFLTPSGERHEAAERSVPIGPIAFGESATEPFPEGRVELASEPGPDGQWRVSCAIHNTVEVPDGLDRGGALMHSLISTHIVVKVAGGRFVSPLEAEGCQSINTFPVLATPEDDAILGAAIVLPDHPRIAEESRVNLFDNSEIEEALLLHVHALSEAERASIADQDPAVREMIARALATTPEEMIRLHGGLKPTSEVLRDG
ncbi:MAG: hypothetical protein QOE27_387 [Solirubrobacteraceae bacterium]|nr:hypothetical protein [Solirubrobacteraceae bacterium]